MELSSTMIKMQVNAVLSVLHVSIHSSYQPYEIKIIFIEEETELLSQNLYK